MRKIILILFIATLFTSCMKNLEVYTITAESNNATLGFASGGGTYTAGSTAILTAIPQEGGRFVKWSGYGDPTDNPLKITVSEDRSYMAIFENIKTYTITVMSNDTNFGTVYGGGNFVANSTIFLTAFPKAGCKFAKWTGSGGISTDNPLQVIVTSNQSYTAIFVRTSIDYSDLPSFSFDGHIYKVAPDPHTSAEEFISWTAANSYCESLTAYGHSDWRMPTVEELETMYLNRNSIGGFISGSYSYYHSSTSYFNYNGEYHYLINWLNGSREQYDVLSADGYSGGLHAHVRPIRIDH